MRQGINSDLQIVVGRVYAQTITGTTFKHKVLRFAGMINKTKYLQVENIETGHKQIIPETELNDLP